MKKTIGLLSVFIISAISTFAILNSIQSQAADIANFKPGNIISDTVFTNNSTMTANDIQNFLNKNNSCLKDMVWPGLYDLNGNGNVDDKTSEPYGVNGNMSSAQIIKAAADIYRINPQVILATLQKESSIITKNCTYINTCMGAGCPDTAACDDAKKGFVTQVDYGTSWFRGYMNGKTNFPKNRTYSIDGQSVYVENNATGALYTYTPHIHGNQNFWVIFTDWFGSTHENDTLGIHPDGTLIDIDGNVYLIQNGSLNHIINGDVFESHGYKWSEVKRATSGDRNLTKSFSIDFIKPGVLYKDDKNVYVTIYSDGKYIKQVMSASSANSLNIKWDKVVSIAKSSMPSGSATQPYQSNRHPDGTLITDGKDVYYIDHGTRRHVNMFVFGSYRWDWSNIYHETTDDKKLPRGADMLLREGTVLHGGSNLYIVKLPATGAEIKQPIGPWECFSNVFQYKLSEAVTMTSAQLPKTTGKTITCN